MEKQSTPFRKEKIAELISHKASQFISENSNRSSLITVTHAELSKDFKEAVIFVTVFPEDREEQVMDFLSRNRQDFRNFLRNERLRVIPRVDFVIDRGEKHRQKIDEISREI